MAITIQAAIDTLIAAVPGAPFPDTVDTIKIGDPSQAITGIVTTFLATCAVIETAAQLGANFIIAHEPTFYEHRDAAHWLEANGVVAAKRRLIQKHHLVIWRFHDYLHSLSPDSTLVGLIHALGWDAYVVPDRPPMCRIPPMTFRQLALTVKEKLGVSSLRLVGDFDLTCRTVALLPGFPGPEMQIGCLDSPDVDVVITGEIHEWETSEYARDAVHLGLKKALIVTGHAASEEPGMKWIIPWLQERLPGIPITFVPTGSAFQPL
jgi:putative NIF3 family GTP cyclohydrolase 1 type 2